MKHKLILVSHHLCPYVQRAAISLTEKGVPFERVDIDLANKPDWFKAISPLGKVPLLRVQRNGDETAIFELAVILEFLEETQAHPSTLPTLMPAPGIAPGSSSARPFSMPSADLFARPRPASWPNPARCQPCSTARSRAGGRARRTLVRRRALFTRRRRLWSGLPLSSTPSTGSAISTSWMANRSSGPGARR